MEPQLATQHPEGEGTPADDVLQQVLAAFEADAEDETADLFTRVVVEYLATTRTGSGPVSTGASPAQVAARFDEPLPIRGRPIGEVIARVEADVLPDCNRLMHPRAMGHQVSAPLPVAVWMEALTAALNQS